MKSKRAIRLELQRVERGMKAKNDPNVFGRELMGAQQALAWALEHDAMAPARCYGPRKVSNKSSDRKEQA